MLTGGKPLRHGVPSAHAVHPPKWSVYAGSLMHRPGGGAGGDGGGGGEGGSGGDGGDGGEEATHRGVTSIHVTGHDATSRAMASGVLTGGKPLRHGVPSDHEEQWPKKSVYAGSSIQPIVGMGGGGGGEGGGSNGGIGGSGGGGGGEPKPVEGPAGGGISPPVAFAGVDDGAAPPPPFAGVSGVGGGAGVSGGDGCGEASSLAACEGGGGGGGEAKDEVGSGGEVGSG